LKLLIDAQLPRKLALWLAEHGHDTIHTLDLPEANRTTDREICLLADRESRVVVTKDSNFFENHILQGTPSRLLIVATGNISNRDLIRLFQANLSEIDLLLQSSAVVEINSLHLIAH